mmetsp:Transcript_21258/g.61876  ORF Transcript_21258/g.61876 Transcript_21258/m.61876 type:complete len:289 (-) Transcript_21258:356-1222(-)
MNEEEILHEYIRRVQEDSDGNVPNVILFVFCFFTIWNMIICIHTVKACSGLVRGEFNEAAPTLFCPHWLVGIAIPMYVGYSWYGIAGLFFCMIPFIVPHALGILWLRYRGQQAHTAPGLHVEASGGQNEMSATQTTGRGGSSDLRGMTEEERTNYLDKILITKKVVKGESISFDPAGKSASYRSRHPKSDITVAHDENEKSIFDQVFSSVAGENDDNSAKICSICLEEYQEDEEICWSRNPECSHVFHKNCLVDWLVTDISCPNCRTSYVGDFCENEPETYENEPDPA